MGTCVKMERLGVEGEEEFINRVASGLNDDEGYPLTMAIMHGMAYPPVALPWESSQ